MTTETPDRRTPAVHALRRALPNLRPRPLPGSTPLASAVALASRARGDALLLTAMVFAVAYHGGLLLSGTYAHSYDAFVHIFFADHYAHSWFTTWEPRWYTGFSLSSYPPGSHQMVALVSHLVGLRTAFCVVMTLSVLQVTIGVYRFARIWVDRPAAGWAAILCATSTSITETVHVYGQLPTMFSLGFLLNAMPFVHRWITRGRRYDLLAGVALTAATTAGHHVTTLFGSVFFTGPVAVSALLEALRTPREGEPGGRPAVVSLRTAAALSARRVRRLSPAARRAAVYGVLAILCLLIVVLPYWLWSKADPITQVPIPHASRDSFIKNENAGLIFWIIPWGLLILLLPASLWRGYRSRSWPLAASISMLFLLGTGGTTPIPHMLLGKAYEILTLDRFTFWATVAVLPLAGSVVRDLAGWAQRSGRPARALLGLAGVAAMCASLFTANLASYRPMEPAPIDMGPIVSFLAKDQHWRWRYLSLGFGDQMAWLSALTPAQTVDGDYFSARRLPELTTTPIERLDGAKFQGVPGLGSLQEMLGMPEKYRLKFVFTVDEFYDPLLYFSGWTNIGRLDDGVSVWQRDDVPPLPTVMPTREIPKWQLDMWGVLPPAAIFSALLLGPLASLLHSRGRFRRPRRRHRWPFPFSLARSWDAFLLRRCAVPDGPQEGPLSAGWGTVAGLAGRLRDRVRVVTQRLPRPPVRRWHVVTVTLGVLVAMIAVADYIRVQVEASPVAVVQAYYEDLDFARLPEAYSRLDQSHLSLGSFELDLAAQGGLLPSYAKLESVTGRVIARRADRVWVRVHLLYLTSVQAYPITRVQELRMINGRWRLEPMLPDASQPAEELSRHPRVQYYDQGRRHIGDPLTQPADILDRPKVQILSARLVRADKRWEVVGDLVNTDDNPADVTITAQLLDPFGRVLTEYNATELAIHQLRPKEWTPFRVDFEGIAGASNRYDPAAGFFNPAAFTPARFRGRPEGISIFASAVVTTENLDRDVTLQGVQAHVLRNGWVHVTGTAFNGTSQEATIPRILGEADGLDGEVAWVNQAFLPYAIEPGRSERFDLKLPPHRSLLPLQLPLGISNNGVPSQPAARGRIAPVLTLPASSGYGHLRLTVDDFVRPKL